MRIKISPKVSLNLEKIGSDEIRISKCNLTSGNKWYTKSEIRLSNKQIKKAVNNSPEAEVVDQLSDSYRIFFGIKTVGTGNSKYYAIAEEENNNGEYKVVYRKNIYIPLDSYPLFRNGILQLLGQHKQESDSQFINEKESELDEEDLTNSEKEETNENSEEDDNNEESISTEEQPLPEIEITASPQLYKDVLEYIKENQGCTTGDVIKALDTEPNEIVDTLVSGVDKDLKLVNGSRWTLKDDNEDYNEEKSHTEDDTIPTLKNIINYYLDFTVIDSGLNKKVRLFTEDIGKSFFLLDQRYQEQVNELFLKGSTKIILTEDEKAFSKYIFTKKASKLFLGMPLLFKPTYDEITRKYTDNTREVTPMFSIPLEFSLQAYELTVSLTNQAPVFNLESGKRLQNFPSKDDINDEFGLQEQYDYDELSVLNVSKIITERTKSVLPAFKTFNIFELDSLKEDLESEKPSFKNVCVIYRSVEDKYTKNLINELRSLSEMDEDTLQTSSLNLLLQGSSEVKNKSQVVNISPLNDEQENAVQLALNNRFTCVSGPPGTGKSYVIENLLTSIIGNNKTALFASKNQQAVKIVEDKLNSAFEDGVLFRWAKGVEGRLELIAKKIQRIIATQGEELTEGELVTKREKLLKHKESLLEQVGELSVLLGALDKTNNELLNLEKVLGISSSNRSALQEIDIRNLVKVFKKLYTFKFSLWERLTKNQSRKRGLENDLIFQFNQFQNAVSNNIKLPVLSLAQLGEMNEKIEIVSEYLSTLKKFTQDSKKLMTMPKLENIAKELDYYDEKLVELNKKFVLHTLTQKENAAKVDNEISLSLHAFNSYVQHASSATKNTRNNLDRARRCFSDVLKVLPIWSTSNLSAYYYPLSQDLFDYLIIDEATQSDLPSLIPLLYRAKSVVVIGDDLQLQKITSVTNNFDEKLHEKHKLGFRSGYKFSASRNSVFDLAFLNRDVPKVVLTEHFRCHPDIIQFANDNWYSKRNILLEPYTTVEKVKGYDYLAVDIIDVPTSKSVPSISGLVNPQEAEAVLAKLKEFIRTTDESMTIGVVTPFRHQAIKITDLIQKHIPEEVINDRQIIAATAHKFQGDARDIILFSPVISNFYERHKTKVENGYRFLNSQSELFNVAITRAKSGFVVVGNKKVLAECPVDYLRNLVTYVDNLRVAEEENRSNRSEMFESPLEKILYDRLSAENIKVEIQYPLDRFRLDYAYINTHKKVDIELDGTEYHTDFSGKRVLSDIRRDRHVQSRGWEVTRYWSYEVLNNLDEVLNDIKKKIQ